MTEQLPLSWRSQLASHIDSKIHRDLCEFVAKERAEQTIFPTEQDVYNAFHHTSYDDVRVLLLGQDPYHGAGQAHGLCFSVPVGVKPPPSLRNMLKELADDLGIPPVQHGDLSTWARQGVLLLNTVLTVREGQANSHQKQGWEAFTDNVIEMLSQRKKPVVFVLWGNSAKKKSKLMDASRHKVIVGAHPSPLSAYRGFFGSKPFSSINEALKSVGHTPIDWQLP